jgi:hypothetical protein
VAVHDVKVQPVDTGAFQFADDALEVAEIGRGDACRDFDLAHLVALVSRKRSLSGAPH